VLKERAGRRVYKVALDAGSGYPNRDVVLSANGCFFCNERSYYPTKREDRLPGTAPIHQQLEDGIAYVGHRHGADAFIAYFQRGSHTYGPLEKLRAAYEAAIDHPDVVGLAISTRPDCISDALCDAIADIATRTFLWMELGLQSAHERTLANLNHGHTVQDFVDSHTKLKARNIPTCAHIILGLPSETRNQMIETACFLADNEVWGVKIHNLHVLKNTELAQMHARGEVVIPTLEEYASMVTDFLEQLPPETVVHRVNSHSPRDITIAPKWSVNKLGTFNAVQAELVKRDSWQGKKLTVKSEE